MTDTYSANFKKTVILLNAIALTNMCNYVVYENFKSTNITLQRFHKVPYCDVILFLLNKNN